MIVAADHLRRDRRGLPFTPLAARRSASPRCPLAFFLILLGMIAAYLVLVEVVKARFYAVQARPEAARPTVEQRRHRHIRRRARRFTVHGGPSGWSWPVAP